MFRRFLDALGSPQIRRKNLRVKALDGLAVFGKRVRWSAIMNTRLRDGDRFPLLVFSDHATVVDPRGLHRHRTQTGLNRPLAMVTMAYHESMALLIHIAGVFLDIRARSKITWSIGQRSYMKTAENRH